MSMRRQAAILLSLLTAGGQAFPIDSPLIEVTGGKSFPGQATDATGQFEEAALKLQGCDHPIWKSEVLGFLTPREPIVRCAQAQSPWDLMALPPDKRDLLQ